MREELPFGNLQKMLSRFFAKGLSQNAVQSLVLGGERKGLLKRFQKREARYQERGVPRKGKGRL